MAFHKVRQHFFAIFDTYFPNKITFLYQSDFPTFNFFTPLTLKIADVLYEQP